jgi:NADH:ubiquinone oxidoreductase subunit E
MSVNIKPHHTSNATQEDQYAKISEIIEGYRGKDGCLIPVLHIAQGLYHELTPELLHFIADKLGMPYAKVDGAATFYAHFALTQTCKFSHESSEEIYQNIGDIIASYRGKAGGLIPVLHIAQGIYGHLTPDLLQIISEKLDIPLSKVTGIATFYSYYSITPKGQYTIRVCMGSSCYKQGSLKILEQMKELLGIEVGETTPDGKFTLEVVRCIGECDKAPGISINDSTTFKRVRAERVGEILKAM